MTAPGLEVDDITLRLGRFALRGASFSVAPGEILVLLGRNGAGKSVCLETIAGFHKPASGRIALAGREVTHHAPEERHIAFLIQNFGLFPHLTIAANVAVGIERTRDTGAIRALLARFGIAHLADALPEHLSPGEQQRAALARALASRPNLYLFDEPFAALDAATAERLRDELAGFLRGTGAPSVFVTHDRVEARALADRVAVIEDGTIRQHGPAPEVFARPGSIAVAELVGIENILEGEIAADAGAFVRVSVGGTTIDVVKPEKFAPPPRRVTLCIRAENVHLLPPQTELGRDRLRARVVAVSRVGALSKVLLDCGFSLIAYALPQTLRAAAIVPGAAIDAEIDRAAIHLIAADGPV